MTIDTNDPISLLAMIPAAVLVVILRIVLAALAVWVGFRLTHRAENTAERLARRARPQDPDAFSRALRRLVSVGGMGLSIAVGLAILGVNVEALVTGLGLTSLALGFALKDTIEQAVTGMLILFQQPFKVGDLIEVNGVEGTVTDVAIRSTDVRTADGLHVLIPNNIVFHAVIRNKTHYSTRRFEVSLLVYYGSDLQLAHTVIRDATACTRGVLPDPAPTVAFEAFEGNGIRAVSRYWTAPASYDWVELRNAVSQNIADACAQAGVAVTPAQQAALAAAAPLTTSSTAAPVPAADGAGKTKEAAK